VSSGIDAFPPSMKVLVSSDAENTKNASPDSLTNDKEAVPPLFGILRQPRKLSMTSSARRVMPPTGAPSKRTCRWCPSFANVVPFCCHLREVFPCLVKGWSRHWRSDNGATEVSASSPIFAVFRTLCSEGLPQTASPAAWNIDPDCCIPLDPNPIRAASHNSQAPGSRRSSDHLDVKPADEAGLKRLRLARRNTKVDAETLESDRLNFPMHLGPA
jgi:hypothetical protein